MEFCALELMEMSIKLMDYQQLSFVLHVPVLTYFIHQNNKSFVFNDKKSM